jgi:AcrR family transcriptional regulator
MNHKLDRRKKYTRLVLKNSLITLLKTKSLSKITVKEICEEADVNRSTFYAHYHDQFDLLEKIEQEVIANVEVALNEYDFSKDDEAVEMIEVLLDYVSDNFDLFYTLLIINRDHSFEKRVMDLARKYLIKNWENIEEADAMLYEYGGTFVISGSIYVIKQWMTNQMDRSPTEIAKLINSFKLRVEDV